jgi:hypothetical protein
MHNIYNNIITIYSDEYNKNDLYYEITNIYIRLNNNSFLQDMNNINNNNIYYYFPATMIFFSDKKLNEIIRNSKTKIDHVIVYFSETDYSKVIELCIKLSESR